MNQTFELMFAAKKRWNKSPSLYARPKQDEMCKSGRRVIVSSLSGQRPVQVCDKILIHKGE